MPEFGRNFGTEIAVRLRAEGIDQADLIERELTRVRDRAANVAREWTDGTRTAGEYLSEMRSLTAEFSAWTRAARDVDSSLDRQSASYAKLVSDLQRDSDQINKLLQAEADAAEAAALREAEAFGKAAAAHEKFMADANAAFQAQLRKNGAAIERDLTSGMVPLGKLQLSAADLSERLEKGMTKGTGAAKGFGSSMLQLSYALQDVQYGLRNAVNNIPGIVMALGGSAGLAGGLMVAAVAFDFLAPKINQLGVDLGLIEDPAARARTAIERLESTLKEIEAKPIKLGFDYSDLRNARDELARLKADEESFDAMKKARTTLQERVSARVKRAVVEEAGGTDEESGAANLAKLVEEAQRRQGTFTVKPETVGARAKLEDLQGRLARTRKELEDPLLSPERQSALWKLEDNLETQVKETRAAIDEASRKAVEALVGAAGRGIGSALDEVIRAMDEQADVFAKGAPGAVPVAAGLRGSLELARAANVKMAEENEKANRRQLAAMQQQARDEGERKQLAARAEQGEQAMRAARDRAISQDISTFGTKEAHGGLLEAEVRKLAAEKVKPEDMLDRLLGPEKERLRGAHVEEGNLDAVARGLANKARETALAKLTATPEFARGGLEAAARAAIEADEAKAKGKVEKAEKPEIAREASRIGREIGPDVHDAILRRAGRKESDEQIRAGLAGQVGKRVADAEVEPGLVPDVAAKIIADELGKVRAEQVGRGGINPQTARVLLGERQAKGLGQQRGRERQQQGVVVEQLAGQIFQESAPMTGVQFTPDQARAAAQQAVSMTNRGANATQATIGAMQNVLNAMQQLGQRLDGIEMQAHAAGARAQQFGNQMAKQRVQRPWPWGTIAGG